MISFDVVSLFTKVPIEGALQIISTLLSQDDSLGNRTCISVSDICDLAKLCLRSTYFQFQDTFIEQVNLTMGFSLSPIVANLFCQSIVANLVMETLEQKVLESIIRTDRRCGSYMLITPLCFGHIMRRSSRTSIDTSMLNSLLYNSLVRRSQKEGFHSWMFF